MVFVLRYQISRQILCLRWRQGQNDSSGIWPLLRMMLLEFWVLPGPVLPIDSHFAVNQYNLNAYLSESTCIFEVVFALVAGPLPTPAD